MQRRCCGSRWAWRWARCATAALFCRYVYYTSKQSRRGSVNCIQQLVFCNGAANGRAARRPCHSAGVLFVSCSVKPKTALCFIVSDCQKGPIDWALRGRCAILQVLPAASSSSIVEQTSCSRSNRNQSAAPAGPGDGIAAGWSRLPAGMGGKAVPLAPPPRKRLNHAETADRTSCY